MNGPIRRVAFVLFALFGLLLSAVTYLQVIKGPDYRDDPRNDFVELPVDDENDEAEFERAASEATGEIVARAAAGEK